jgi:uncharacterized protein YukE
MTVPGGLAPSPETIRTLKEWADKVGGNIQKLVAEAIKFVQMGLGNGPRVDAARDAWNVKAVGHVASAANGINGAFPDLKARWSGPAFTAFDAYNATIVNSATPKVTKALTDVGAALTNAKTEVTNTYVAVVDLMGKAAKAILNYTGSVAGSIAVDLAAAFGDVAKAIVDALITFVEAYVEAMKAALKNIAGYKTAANQAAAAIATLGAQVIPPLPQAAGDEKSYVPVKAG